MNNIEINHKNILLDVGDTLVEISEPFEVYTKQAIQNIYPFFEKQIDMSTDEFEQAVLELRNQIRTKAHETLYEYSFQDFIKEIEAFFKVDVSSMYLAIEKAYISAELAITKPITGVHKFLSHAKSNMKQLIVSTNNFSSLHVHAILDKFELNQYVDSIFISGEMHTRKPSKSFIDMICEKKNLLKQETLIIGDKLEMDIAAAVASKIDSCWYNANNKPESDLPTYTVSSFEQIIFK